MTAEDVKRSLGLQPHPREGGWFLESYRAGDTWTAGQRGGSRHLSTAIYYLLEQDTFSEMHRLASDEVFHHYAGAMVEMLQLRPDGHAERILIGSDLAAGQRPQVVVPRGVWQGARILPEEAGEGAWSLLGCTVSPGFEYADYEVGDRAELMARFPAEPDLIRALTRDEE